MKPLYIFIIFLLCCSFVYAAPAIKTLTFSSGTPIISGLFFDSYKYGHNIEFEWHYFNSSGVPKNLTQGTTCAIHIYQNINGTLGNHLYIDNQVLTTSNKYDFEKKITASNFSIGEYIVLIQCENNNEGTFIEHNFYVTRNGTLPENNETIGIILIIFGIIATLLIINFQISNEHILLKIFFYYIIFAMISLLPSVYFITDTTLILHKAISRLVIVFWLYIATFIIYYILKKLMAWIK